MPRDWCHQLLKAIIQSAAYNVTVPTNMALTDPVEDIMAVQL